MNKFKASFSETIFPLAKLRTEETSYQTIQIWMTNLWAKFSCCICSWREEDSRSEHFSVDCLKKMSRPLLHFSRIIYFYERCRIMPIQTGCLHTSNTKTNWLTSSAAMPTRSSNFSNVEADKSRSLSTHCITNTKQSFKVSCWGYNIKHKRLLKMVNHNAKKVKGSS